MDNYLTKIAKSILSNRCEGISKVKFAKTIYFVHKGLIKDNLVETNKLAFLRMPLGPVPVGFMELANDKSFDVRTENIGLSYNQQIFSLKCKKDDGYFQNEIKSLLDRFINCPTSTLVRVSHEEPSWINHTNGQEFFISTDDLDKPMPKAKAFLGLFRTKESGQERQKMQVQLLNGMIDEIAEETTSLEYPER